jgi:hypothetical protein
MATTDDDRRSPAGKSWLRWAEQARERAAQRRAWADRARARAERLRRASAEWRVFIGDLAAAPPIASPPHSAEPD